MSNNKKIKSQLKFKAEALDKLTYLLWETGEQLIHFVITYDNHFNFKLLKKAMRITFDIEPILGCKFVDTFNEPYWERLENIEENEYCSLSHTENFDASLYEFVAKDYQIHSELPIQIRVFRLGSKDVICLKVSHMVTDGGGIFEYIKLLNFVYSKLLNNEAIEIIPNLETRSITQVLYRITLLKRIKAFRGLEPPERVELKFFTTQRRVLLRQGDKELKKEIFKRATKLLPA